MTKDQLDKANEIQSQLHCISDIQTILSYPYPAFVQDHETVNMISLGDDTIRELKEVINTFLDAKRVALTEKFNKL